MCRDENNWKQEWGGPVFCSHGTNDSKGVAILFEQNSNYKVLDISESEGRLILLRLTIGSKDIVLINVYAPNTDDVTFFQNIAAKCMDVDSTDIIIGGTLI